MRRTACLGRYGRHGSLSGRMFGFMLRHPANGTGTNLRRKFVRRFACDKPHVSRVGVSGKLAEAQSSKV